MIAKEKNNISEKNVIRRVKCICGEDEKRNERVSACSITSHQDGAIPIGVNGGCKLMHTIASTQWLRVTGLAFALLICNPILDEGIIQYTDPRQ